MSVEISSGAFEKVALRQILEAGTRFQKRFIFIDLKAIK
jgi:hypothetical protein